MIVEGGRAASAGIMALVAAALATSVERASAQSVADSAWAVGDIALAQQLYEGQLSEGAATQRALHRLALIHAWSEEYEVSLDLFDRLVQGAPDNVEALLDRARVLSWQDDLDGSAAAYGDVLESHPDNREAHLGLARVRSWGSDLAGAEQTYADMLEIDPRDAEALAGHARMAAWSGDLSSAERRWRVGLDRHPDDVVLLTGLGATLRWQGQSSAAVEVLERALTLAPDNAEARQEYRLARLSIAPRLGPSLSYESDSDGNRIATLWHDQSLWPSRWLSINTNGYLRTASLTGRTGEAYGGMVELRFRVPDGWELDAGAGATGTTAGEAATRPQFRVRIASPGRLPAQIWVRHWRRALDETEPLMRNGVEIAETSLGIRGALGKTRGEASVSRADYRATEDNRRLGAALGISHRLSGPWTLGGSMRAFGFEEDRSDGYFDPPVYRLLELRVGWAQNVGDWHLGFTASPGAQKVGRGEGSISGSARARASIGYEFGPGQLASLYAGYSSAGLRSFSTGAADYRYFSMAFAVGWAF